MIDSDLFFLAVLTAPAIIVIVMIVWEYGVKPMLEGIILALLSIVNWRGFSQV